MKWIFTTLLAIIGVFTLIRLGIWQLDRLEWRRTFNKHYLEQMNAEPINLNKLEDRKKLSDMEYRKIFVEGKFYHEDEFYLRNQAWNNQPGYHILTPFQIAGSDEVVLIDRGWIPLSGPSSNTEIIRQENEVIIHGIIRLPQETNDFGYKPEDNNDEERYLQIVSFSQINQISSHDFITVYIQETSSGNDLDLPVPVLPEIEITEGPHMGYAIQWFFFALLLGAGYPVYMRKMVKEESDPKKANNAGEVNEH